MQNCTTDFFLDGQIRLLQPETGYRVSMDPFFLCRHVVPENDQKVLDIGCGSGIIPLLLTRKNPSAHITGVEIQPELARLARRNVEANQMGDRITILNKDARELTLPDIRGPVDLIVSNPPFKKQNSGRLNPSRQKAVAKHEIELTLEDVLRQSSALLSSGGTACIIFPAERTPEILILMEKYRIQPAMIRFLHPRKPDSAKFVIVGGIKGGAGALKVASPLFIYNDQNEWTSEVKQMFSS